MYEYEATVLRVVDGDTIDVQIDLGFSTFTKERLRIARLDTPETWRPKTEEERELGKLATADAERLLPVGSYIIVKTKKKGGAKGARGRYIAEISVNGKNFTDTMTSLGHNKMEKSDG
jgi:micrococcal nuclease